MRVKFNFLSVDSNTFVVKSDNHEFAVDSLSTQIVVDFSSNQEKVIEIVEQHQHKTSLLDWIIWILTIPLQGLMNAIISYGDDVWYKQINPYSMVAELAIIPADDSDINISFTESKYEQWLCTNVECKQAKAIKIKWLPHPEAVYTSYTEYVKRVVSISSVGIALFVFLLCQMIAASNTIGVVICGLLTSFIVGLDVLLAITQYHKAQKLHASFMETHF